MKGCTKSLVVRKPHIKIIMSFYYTPIRLAKIFKIYTILNVGEDAEDQEL